MNLTDLREQAEQLARALQAAALETALGRAGTPDFAGLAAAAPLVTSREAVPRLRELAAKAEGRRRTRLVALAAFVSELRGFVRAASSLEAIDAALGGPGVRATALATLRESSGRVERERFAATLSEGLQAASRAGFRVFEARAEAAREDGFDDPLAARATLLGIDRAAFEADVRAFLSATDAAYEEVLGWWLDRTAGVRPHPRGAERHDLLFALAGGPFSQAFPARATMQGAVSTFAGTPLDPVAGGRLRFDVFSAPSVGHPAFTGGPASPGTVRLVVRDRPGPEALREFLRAFGEGQARAACDPERPAEDVVMGDPVVPLATGVVFGQLAEDAAWLRRATRVEDDDVRRVVALVELARLRNEAAKHLHLVDEFRDGPGPSTDAHAAERTSSLTGARVDAETAVVDVLENAWIPGRSAHEQLVAAALGHAWALGLRDRFDADWWRNPRAAPALRLTWAHGQLLHADEVVAALELPKPSLAAVGARLVSALGG